MEHSSGPDFDTPLDLNPVQVQFHMQAFLTSSILNPGGNDVVVVVVVVDGDESILSLCSLILEFKVVVVFLI